MQIDAGVDLRTGVAVQGLDGDASGHVRQARLSDGTVLDINGVVTDNIFVAGDVARAPHVLYVYEFMSQEHWDNAVFGAEVAANNMITLGLGRRPHLLLTSFWSRPVRGEHQERRGFSFGDEIVLTQGSIEERRFAAAPP